MKISDKKKRDLRQWYNSTKIDGKAIDMAKGGQNYLGISRSGNRKQICEGADKSKVSNDKKSDYFWIEWLDEKGATQNLHKVQNIKKKMGVGKQKSSCRVRQQLRSKGMPSSEPRLNKNGRGLSGNYLPSDTRGWQHVMQGYFSSLIGWRSPYDREPFMPTIVQM